MNKHFINISFKYFLALIGGLIIFFICSQFTTETISENSSILPSIATFENIDIGKRISNFYWSIFWSTLAFAILSWSLKSIELKPSYLLDQGLALIFVVSLFVFDLMNLLHIEIPLIIIAAYTLNSISLKNNTPKIPLLKLIYILPLALLIIEFSNLNYFTEYQFYLSLSLISIIWIRLLKNGIPIETERKLTLFITTIPFLLVVYKEFYMILNQNNFHSISPIYFLIILLIFNFIFANALSNYLQSKSKAFIDKGCAILLLMGLILWKNYYTVYQHQNEIFELANLTNPIMRMFKFGEIPILEHLSSHVFSDISLNPFYILLNGNTETSDFMIYFTLINPIIIPGAFLVLNRIFKNPFFVFCILLFLPSYELILGHGNGYIFITLLIVWQFLKQPSTLLLFSILLLNSILIVYKIEVGSSSLIMTVVLILIQLIANHKPFKSYLLKGGLVFIIFVLILIAICFSIEPNLIDNFLKSKDYFTSNQAHGFAKVALNKDSIYYFNYIILPLLLSFYSVILIRKQIQNKSYNFFDFTLIGLISFYLFHAQRGLVRHSLIENSTFHISSFAYLILSLIVFKTIKSNHQFIKYSAFLSTFIISSNLFSLDQAFVQPSNLSKIIYKANLNQKLQHYTNKKKRALDFDEIKEKESGDLNRFMTKHFDPEATFLDFCNVPMLYFYTQREIPSYFNQYMQNTVTDYLQQKNIAILETKNIPLVLFSQNPHNFWDAIDGVENTIRNFRMSQYIYQNYKPHSAINQKNVWLKNGLNIPNEFQNVQNLNHHYNLMQYPSILGKYSKSAYKPIAIWKRTLNFKSISDNNRINEFIKITFNEISDYEALSISYFNESHSFLGEFKFTGKSKIFIVPVNAQYNWYKNKTLQIEIKGSQQIPQTIELMQLDEYKK